MKYTVDERFLDKIKELLDWVSRLEDAELKTVNLQKDWINSRSKQAWDYAREAEELLLEINYLPSA